MQLRLEIATRGQQGPAVRGFLPFALSCIPPQPSSTREIERGGSKLKLRGEVHAWEVDRAPQK